LEVTHFHIFQSYTWAHIPFKKREALIPQSTTCIFVGYRDGVKGYRLLDPSTNKLIVEHIVQFEESPCMLHLSHMQRFLNFHQFQMMSPYIQIPLQS
jgi:hypothetical protein